MCINQFYWCSSRVERSFLWKYKGSIEANLVAVLYCNSIKYFSYYLILFLFLLNLHFFCGIGNNYNKCSSISGLFILCKKHSEMIYGWSVNKKCIKNNFQEISSSMPYFLVHSIIPRIITYQNTYVDNDNVRSVFDELIH